MRKLTKGPKPPVLEAHEHEWTDEFTDALANGIRPLPARYGHSDIRSALRDETHQKCAYCESRVEHVAPTHVEHIRPKSRRPDLVVAWVNLTLGCPACNTNKGDYYSEEEPLLHPYDDAPSTHLIFVGNLVLPKPGSDTGVRTVGRLKLSRPGLIQQRTDRLTSVHRLVDAWHRANGLTKAELEDQIREEARPDSEYSACVTEFLRQQGFPV